MSSYIHPSAEIAPTASIGAETKVWALSQVREQAKIGRNCIIGRNVFVDLAVEVGDNCKIQNNALLYEGLTLEDGVFVGPGVCFTNDKLPRAINSDGTLKSSADWTLGKTLVKYGASVGAATVVVTGVTLGRFCMVGSGAVVTHDVPDFGLVLGNPARLVGYVCRCANRLSLIGIEISISESPTKSSSDNNVVSYECLVCGRHYQTLPGTTTITEMLLTP
jgi:acetyltransferase-like isoleucine patch superfamily enzyme